MTVSPVRDRIADPSDLMILGGKRGSSVAASTSPRGSPKREMILRELGRGERRSTIFCPREGIFRTVSQAEAEEHEAVAEVAEGSGTEDEVSPEAEEREYSRTPSVEPPSISLHAQDRISLLSLLNAPHDAQADPSPVTFNIPSMPITPCTTTLTTSAPHTAPEDPGPSQTTQPPSPTDPERPHTAAAFYTVRTTTTTVPVRETFRNEEYRDEACRTPSAGSVRACALTPATMTRDEALAKIRERRARSGEMKKHGTPMRVGSAGDAGRRSVSRVR